MSTTHTGPMCGTMSNTSIKEWVLKRKHSKNAGRRRAAAGGEDRSASPPMHHQNADPAPLVPIPPADDVYWSSVPEVMGADLVSISDLFELASTATLNKAEQRYHLTLPTRASFSSNAPLAGEHTPSSSASRHAPTGPSQAIFERTPTPFHSPCDSSLNRSSPPAYATSPGAESMEDTPVKATARLSQAGHAFPDALGPPVAFAALRATPASSGPFVQSGPPPANEGPRIGSNINAPTTAHGLLPQTPLPPPAAPPAPVPQPPAASPAAAAPASVAASVAAPPPPVHVPVVEHYEGREFTCPGQFFRRPTGDDPLYHHNNILKTQSDKWRALYESAVLVRLIYTGYIRDVSENLKVSDRLLKAVEHGIGALPTADIINPDQATPIAGERPPPYSYLLFNLTRPQVDRLLSLECISTPDDTVLLTTTREVIGSYFLSLSNFSSRRRPSVEAVYTLVRNAHTLADIDGAIRETLRPRVNILSEERIRTIIARTRASLRIELVTARHAKGHDFHVAHIFMDSPTTNPTYWRYLRDTMRAVSYADPMLGMTIGYFRGWHCTVCQCMLHPTGLCPFKAEQGWHLPPSLDDDAPKVKPATQPALTQATTPAYSSEDPKSNKPNNQRNHFTGNRRGPSRGRGGNRGGRGRGF